MRPSTHALSLVTAGVLGFTRLYLNKQASMRCQIRSPIGKRIKKIFNQDIVKYASVA